MQWKRQENFTYVEAQRGQSDYSCMNALPFLGGPRRRLVHQLAAGLPLNSAGRRALDRLSFIDLTHTNSGVLPDARHQVDASGSRSPRREMRHSLRAHPSGCFTVICNDL